MSIVDLLFEHVLVSGVTMLCAATMVFALARREVRLRPEAWWACEPVVYIGFAPLVTVVGAAGAVLVGMGVKTWAAQPLPPQGLSVAAAAMLSAGLVWHLLSREPASRDTVRARTATATG